MRLHCTCGVPLHTCAQKLPFSSRAQKQLFSSKQFFITCMRCRASLQVTPPLLDIDIYDKLEVNR